MTILQGSVHKTGSCEKLKHELLLENYKVFDTIQSAKEKKKKGVSQLVTVFSLHAFSLFGLCFKEENGAHNRPLPVALAWASLVFLAQ